MFEEFKGTEIPIPTPKKPTNGTVVGKNGSLSQIHRLYYYYYYFLNSFLSILTARQIVCPCTA